MEPERCCEICDADISHKRSHARYCGERCKKTAQRRGIAVAREPIILERIPPKTVPKRQRKPTVEDLTRLVCDAHALEASLRFAAVRAEYRFRPMCARLADAIGAALDAEELR